jgi:hypothetical protein
MSPTNYSHVTHCCQTLTIQEWRSDYPMSPQQPKVCRIRSSRLPMKPVTPEGPGRRCVKVCAWRIRWIEKEKKPLRRNRNKGFRIFPDMCSSMVIDSCVMCSRSLWFHHLGIAHYRDGRDSRFPDAGGIAECVVFCRYNWIRDVCTGFRNHVTCHVLQ